ncbi:MAG: UDP-N-acetylglucosamine 2-epimerase (non-hydrolyzing) [Candidatus Omnitrophica bacterium]|nr:UDP-N-acetylglucosamine 2-epimerase (non-hydrolyzing) [Candidatus Omnitrophota bacterium]
MLKVILIAGARPNFMKVSALYEEVRKYPRKINPIVVHTGQHFDRRMSHLFFHDLNLPKPDYYLNVGSLSHAQQTAKVLERLEPVLLKENPDIVIVVGDVNSTVAAALCASKLNIPVAHVEAGLRSFDRTMPEETNRILTDAISDYLFVTEEAGVRNLLKEGVSRNKIHFVGNVMIDTLKAQQKKAAESSILKELSLQEKKYALLTLHRPSNVDNKESFLNILKILETIQKDITVIWPVHPRTDKMIDVFRLKSKISPLKNLKMIPALGYLDFLKLMADAKFVLTDSGGIQEETTILNVPCLTLRENTERPVTISMGTNVLTGQNYRKIISESRNILKGKGKKGRIPPLWDGLASQRIIAILLKNCSQPR